MSFKQRFKVMAASAGIHFVFRKDRPIAEPVPVLLAATIVLTRTIGKHRQPPSRRAAAHI